MLMGNLTISESDYLRGSSTTIQKWIRGYLIKKEFINKKKVAETIQKLFRNKKESIIFKDIIKKTFEKYLSNGPRSNQKTLQLHEGLKCMIQQSLPSGYTVEIEKNVKSENASGKKSCDIIVLNGEILCFIFPVKFIMVNYYQNKNNNWENLTGELFHLKKANENINIIPINIIFNTIPYCKKSSYISKFENITYEKSYKITENLVKWKLASNIVNYIIDVEQICKIGEKYDKCPKIIGFNENTPYITFKEILKSIIQ
jgi:hypothetical protein|tara:strand:- start:3338 stop:4111 length:774 start_codon:yes stop_codon:yes gene_type:complete